MTKNIASQNNLALEELGAYLIPLTCYGAGNLGTIHLRRRQIFTIFDSYPPASAVFYYYPSAKLTNFRPLPPTNCRRLKWMVPKASFCYVIFLAKKAFNNLTKQKYCHTNGNDNSFSCLRHFMLVLVVKFSREGYKSWQIFA